MTDPVDVARRVEALMLTLEDMGCAVVVEWLPGAPGPREVRIFVHVPCEV